MIALDGMSLAALSVMLGVPQAELLELGRHKMLPWDSTPAGIYIRRQYIGLWTAAVADSRE